MSECVIDDTGTKRWYQDDKLHRLDRPALEHANGDVEYWVNGLRHKDDGPAVEFSHGSKYWYKEGKQHRLDGPAVEYYDGSKEYWIDGVKMTKMEYFVRYGVANE